MTQLGTRHRDAAIASAMGETSDSLVSSSSVRARVRRREFIALVGSVAAWPYVARAQQPKTIARIGFLTAGSLVTPEGKVLVDAFREGLRDRGHVEGQNIIIEARGADGQIERFP